MCENDLLLGSASVRSRALLTLETSFEPLRPFLLYVMRAGGAIADSALSIAREITGGTR